ncbi:uncharacterized protein KY384_004245 [Bacidia gigantensis]|uniref:uncharacterized protein n=1 Tax=Bacidia gigantensis TaxID=2732470 RepID=UPI001D04A218|nr:uncharacterized protein KY384_004245 [Bacidia gigantensis]KAG8530888.1 hypothetical protein KY384_004245 [Bacidia gigantensis]
MEANIPRYRTHLVPFLFVLFAASSSATPPDVATATASSRAASTQLPFPQSLTDIKQCDSQIAVANASNTFSSVESLDLKTKDAARKQHQVALSLTVNAPVVTDNTSVKINSTVWLGIDKGVDYSSPSLPFSACSLVFNKIPNTTSRRGTSQDGLCAQTYSKECVTDLESKAATMAWDFSKKSSQGESHKGGMFSELPEICNFIADQMTIALPDSCKDFAENNRLWESVDTLPLTGERSLGLSGCNISADSFYHDTGFKSYNTFPIHQSTFISPSNASNATITSDLANNLYYRNVLDQIVPVMRVMMPAVNGNISTNFVKLESAEAEMSCLGANSVKPMPQNPVGIPNSKTSESVSFRAHTTAIGGSGLLAVALAMAFA